MGNVLEPRWMGRGLNLSPLVVFVSLVLWGWVLGPVGMLLSIPLTIMLKIALESQQETRWIGVMLGAGKRLESEPMMPDEPQLEAPKEASR
jgi:AI-2 transport protein TqsA